MDRLSLAALGVVLDVAVTDSVNRLSRFEQLHADTVNARPADLNLLASFLSIIHACRAKGTKGVCLNITGADPLLVARLLAARGYTITCWGHGTATCSFCISWTTKQVPRIQASSFQIAPSGELEAVWQLQDNVQGTFSIFY